MFDLRSMKFSLKSLKKIGRILKPRVDVGGLELSDGGAVFVDIDPETKKVSNFSVKFPADSFVGGKVQNKSAMVLALTQLHSLITAVKNKKIPVVVSISDTDIYTQQFVLPNLKSSSLEEAVRLNLQVISPIDFTSAYTDWERIEDGTGSQEAEILASFAEKAIVDKIYEVLSESQFVPVAIEQRATSITRVISELSNSYNPKNSYFLLYVSSDGLGFDIIRRGYLYFSRFTPWSALVSDYSGQKQISFNEFTKTIIEESHRVINFYSSHFNSSIDSIYVVAPNLEKQVSQIIESSLPLKIEPLVLKDYQIDQNLFIAFGAGLRGIASRAMDVDISLAPEGTEAQFYHSRILAFVSMWRNVLASVFVIILLSMIGVYIFLSSYINRMVSDFSRVSGNYNVSYLNSLKSAATDFNSSVTSAINAKSQQTRWSKALNDINNQATNGVVVSRIYVQSLDLPITLNGLAPTSDAAVDFKNKLAALSYISGVDMPLSGLIPIGPNQVSFSISFKINQSAIQ